MRRAGRYGHPMAVREEQDGIRLADESDFRLGRLLVRPSASSVEGPGGETRLEPRVMAVLLILARSPGQTVSRDALIEACWGGRFVTDNAVSRALTRLRALGHSHADAFKIEALPKIGYRLIVNGEIPNDIGMQGRRHRPDVVWGALALLAALVVATAFLMLDLRRSESAWVTLDDVRVAGGGAPVRQLASALSDSLYGALSASGEEVAPTRAARDPARIAMAASVSRESGIDVVRIRLVSPKSGAVIWSRRVERPGSTVHGFAEVTAAQVAGTVACGRRNAARYGRRMPDGLLSLLLQVCAAQADDDAPAMVAATSRLVAAAPHFASAHGLQAIANIAASWKAGDTTLSEAALVRARAAARKALAISPGEPDAHAALGMDTALSLSERESHFRRALQIEPDSLPANMFYIWFLQEVGRVREATALAATTAARYPLAAIVQERAAWLGAVGGDRPAAEILLRRLDLVDPRIADDLRLRLALWLDPPAQALKTLRFLTAAGRIDGRQSACLAARLELNSVSSPPECQDLQVDIVVRSLARAGRIDEAYAAAHAAGVRQGSSTVYFFYPEMSAFRRDPRFFGFAGKFGLPTYWQRSGHWPDFCGEPDLPFDCRARAASSPRQSGL